MNLSQIFLLFIFPEWLFVFSVLSIFDIFQSFTTINWGESNLIAFYFYPTITSLICSSVVNNEFNIKWNKKKEKKNRTTRKCSSHIGHEQWIIWHWLSHRILKIQRSISKYILELFKRWLLAYGVSYCLSQMRASDCVPVVIKWSWVTVKWNPNIPTHMMNKIHFFSLFHKEDML